MHPSEEPPESFTIDCVAMRREALLEDLEIVIAGFKGRCEAKVGAAVAASSPTKKRNRKSDAAAQEARPPSCDDFKEALFNEGMKFFPPWSNSSLLPQRRVQVRAAVDAIWQRLPDPDKARQVLTAYMLSIAGVSPQRKQNPLKVRKG